MRLAIFVMFLLLPSIALADAGHDLILAAQLGDLEKVKRLVDNGADVNFVHGRTPLMAAVGFNNVEVAEYLLARGADVNGKGNFNDTALLLAAWNRNLGLVQTLLAHGADVNAPGLDGATPLFAAVKGNSETTDVPSKETIREVVRLLLERGANPDVRNTFNQVSALDWAEIRGDKELMKMLLDAGARRSILSQ